MRKLFLATTFAACSASAQAAEELTIPMSAVNDGGNNHSDHPMPVGGGARIVCGVVQ